MTTYRSGDAQAVKKGQRYFVLVSSVIYDLPASFLSRDYHKFVLMKRSGDEIECNIQN